MISKKTMLPAPENRKTWLSVLAFLAFVGLLLAFSLRVQYKRTLAETEDRLMAEAGPWTKMSVFILPSPTCS